MKGVTHLQRGTTPMTSWINQELKEVHFGDRRIDKRLMKIGENFLERPSLSINDGQKDWAGAKAAYRFFENEKVDTSLILESHARRTVDRIKDFGAGIVLAIQDTTYINHSKSPSIEGLAPLTSGGRARGLAIHSTLAVTPDGLPLGLLHQDIFVHQPKYKGRSNLLRNHQPMEEKESYRWIRPILKVNELLGKSVQVIHVGDREADIFELFHKAQEVGSFFLVRANHDRRMKQGFLRTKLWAWMQEQQVGGQIEVPIPASPGQSKRTAICEVRFASHLFNPRPKHRAAQSVKLDSVAFSAIWVQEIHPPADAKAIEWMLLCNLQIDCFEKAIEKIQWYRRRWQIEIFHKILKSGCKVEDCRLNHLDKQRRFLSLMSIIAFRIYWITWIGRLASDQDCRVILSEPEWKILYCHRHKTRKLPTTPPSVQDSIRWIAMLGGFLGRKHDGDPGPIVIWRGMQRLSQMTQVWDLVQVDDPLAI